MSTVKPFAAGVAVAALVLTAFAGSGQPPVAVEEAPAADVATSVHFTASGDISTRSEAAAVLTQVGTTQPDLHFALGDLSYGATGAEQSWCDFVTSRVGAGFPFELISGNHESNGGNGNINDFSACLPNQLPGLVGTYGRQYYVDVPHEAPLVRFIMISPALTYPDGVWTYTAGSPRYQWTSAAIDTARDAGIPWVVVGMHKPCLSVGQYGCDPGAALANLLVSKRVDLVLSGHEHLYARSKQLAQSASCASIVPGSYTAGCIADGDNDLAKGAGTVFMIAGTGGVALRDVSTSDAEAPYFAAYSGLNVNPTYGNLDVTATSGALTARFLPAAGGTFTDAFSIGTSTPVPNVAPTAAFTHAETGLKTSVDGSTSSDTDGTIAGYSWDFGDGGTANGASASHDYAAAGTYQVTLTVTDDDGAQGVLTQAVAVQDPPPNTALASDAFERTVVSGLGSADSGQAWAVSGSAANYSVSGGMGRLTAPASGATLNAYLNSVTSSDTELRVAMAPEQAVTGGGMYMSAIARRVGSSDYRARVKVSATGVVQLQLQGSGGVTLQAANIAGLSYAAGDRLQLRAQVFGTSPTTIRAKVWKLGSPEPANWQLTTTNTASALQQAGAIGLALQLSSTAQAPLTAAFDDLWAGAATGG